MRNYQLVLVLKTSMSAPDRKKLVDGVKDLFKGAKFGKDADLGEKELSYPIKKEKSGVYLNLTLEAENLPLDLDKKLTANENVLRFLILRV